MKSDYSSPSAAPARVFSRCYHRYGQQFLLCALSCLLTLAVLPASLRAQGCAGSVTITSQAEADAFAALGCDTLHGSLKIEDIDLINMPLLPSLKVIKGSFDLTFAFGRHIDSAKAATELGALSELNRVGLGFRTGGLLLG